MLKDFTENSEHVRSGTKLWFHPLTQLVS